MNEENGNGLNSWTKFLKAFGSAVTKVIWSIVGLVVICAMGRWMLFRPRPAEAPRTQVVREVSIEKPVDWGDVDADVQKALTAATERAHAYGKAELDRWTSELQQRIDDDFLNWYFSYWQQQWLGLKSMGYWAADSRLVEKFFGQQPSIAERITEDVQEEFAKRVLRPQIAQLRIERVAETMVQVYVEELDRQIAPIPEKYSISPADWDSYLGDLALLSTSVEGKGNVPVSLKTIALAGVGGGTVAGVRIYQALKPLILKLTSKVTLKAGARGTGQAVRAVAAKTGAKVAAKTGGKLLGPIIGVGVIIWDVWDHQHTKKVERPILRRNLADYLGEMEYCLLDEPGNGLMSVIRQLDDNVLMAMHGE